MLLFLIWQQIQQEINLLDSIRTNQLCMEVIEFFSKILKKDGVFVSKLFMGEDFIEVKKFS